MVTNAAAIIPAAYSFVGVREEPLGTNDGPELRSMLAGTGFTPGQSWCYYFCIAVLRRAFGGFQHIPPCVKVTGSCQLAADFARAHNSLSEFPATGCIFLLMNAAGHFHHAGIVAGYNDVSKTVKTVEGNSNNSGSPEGYEVVAHERPLHNLRFIVWEKQT